MQKLTKDQAEYLIEKIDQQFLMDDQQAAFNDKIVKIINDCTELDLSFDLEVTDEEKEKDGQGLK